MKKVSTIFLTIILFSNLCVGQELTEDENWLKGFHTEADSIQNLTYWEPKKFTLLDVANGKQRLNLIRRYAPQNECEGLYYANTGIGDDNLSGMRKADFLVFISITLSNLFILAELGTRQDLSN